MANRYRGEIAAELDGRQWTLCLTLGALAELEAHFGVSDLSELAARLGSGRLGAGHMATILAAGLRGGGHDVCDDEVREMRCPGGLPGIARIVADLVAATFAVAGGDEDIGKRGLHPPNPPSPQVEGR